MHVVRRLLSVGLLLGCLLPEFASGAMIGFSAQIQTNQDSFTISNTSDAGFSITALELFLGDGTQFDTTLLSLGAASDLSFSPDLATAVVSGASEAEFQFVGFDPGETFGLNVLFVDASGATAVGADLDTALLSVMFSNGQLLTTTFSGGPTSPPTSNRQAFMFDASAAAGPVIAEVPAPASAWLLLWCLPAFGLCRSARRKSV